MIKEQDVRYFNCAKNIAKMSNFKKTSIGCVIVYHNQIISVGYNSNKSHTKQKEYNKFRFSEDSNHKLHAEIAALIKIIDLNINFSKLKLYVYRICKNREYGLARPCPSCMQMIKDFKIVHIYYTTDNGYAYEKIF